MGWRIGIDGGGTKTDCILIDPEGSPVARHVAPGCNPSVVGPEKAREIVLSAIRSLRAGIDAPISETLLCMAGSRSLWHEFGAGLQTLGRVSTADDSLPVLELATLGGPGLALHAGTGSFVAVRAPDGQTHYAGGLGWRFGDPGSGYDIGRRAAARALLEFQGWKEPSGLGRLVRNLTGQADAAATAFFYREASSNSLISGLAPEVLELARRDSAAREAVTGSLSELLGLALTVTRRLFPGAEPGSVKAGLSGQILNHPVALEFLSAAAQAGPLALSSLTESPIEGVRLILLRGGRA